jgi:hypothetical protein
MLIHIATLTLLNFTFLFLSSLTAASALFYIRVYEPTVPFPISVAYCLQRLSPVFETLFRVAQTLLPKQCFLAALEATFSRPCIHSQELCFEWRERGTSCHRCLQPKRQIVTIGLTDKLNEFDHKLTFSNPHFCTVFS